MLISQRQCYPSHKQLFFTRNVILPHEKCYPSQKQCYPCQTQMLSFSESCNPFQTQTSFPNTLLFQRQVILLQDINSINSKENAILPQDKCNTDTIYPSLRHKCYPSPNITYPSPWHVTQIHMVSITNICYPSQDINVIFPSDIDLKIVI